jgi:hypothetical protein
VDHLLGEKTSMIIYFCLIKYHRGNIIERKLFEEVIEEHIKEDGYFASWITSSHY